MSPIAFQIFNLISVGCRTNQYEIQALKEQLEAVGCFYVEKDADLYIVILLCYERDRELLPTRY